MTSRFPALKGAVIFALGAGALALVTPPPQIADHIADHGTAHQDIHDQLHAGAPQTMADWGGLLFMDTNLSASRSMSCATCHDPDAGFVDPREGPAGRAVSLGHDGASLGDRNAPTAAYAHLSPEFGRSDKGKWRGGQFHDGRAKGLTEQAGGPPLNPIEMAMPSEAAVAERLAEDPTHRAALKSLAGIDDALKDPSATYAAMTQAIAEFEKTPVFAPFDSKYDRALRGAYKLTDEEELGRLLFFSTQFANCNLCHQLQPLGGAERETFSNYEFHNIGTPANTEARAQNGVSAVDEGLAAVTKDPADRGKYKVPTLRNVAVTGPYMHNGVFKDLRTVILFYDHYNSKAPKRQINPETGQPWAAPEVPQTLSLTELETGPALQDARIDAMVAFLQTLTDQRYEHLLPQP